MGKDIHFRQLWELFFQFLKVGLFTFGGGYAMISVITDICVEKKLWMTQDEMLDLTVAAESTPGPIAMPLRPARPIRGWSMSSPAPRTPRSLACVSLPRQAP